MKPLQTCCNEWAKAHESGTDNEGYGAVAWELAGEMHLGLETGPVRFCPWCGSPKGVPTPELTGTVPLVLYFATEADRQELIEAIRQAKPGMITKYL